MIRSFLTLILCIVLLSCDSSDPGSGGGIGGTGIKPILANGATQGSISEFGSIVVNGVRFNTDNARFFVNDDSITQSDLRIGMNVLAAVDFSKSEATQVNYVPSLIGPVESINLADSSFQSLGQTIRLGGGTTFNNISISEISPGIVVEVSGLRNATGVLFATFIRPAQNAARIQLVGTVLSDLSNTQQFSLNGLQVNIAQADLSQITTDELSFGSKVYVTADSSGYDSTQNQLAADTVRVALEPMVSVGERVEYEGIVSSVTSISEFDVYWQPIITNDQTRVEFQDGSVGDLSMIMLNTRLEVEAIVQADGSYLASKIILIPTENAKIEAYIEQISANTQSITVLEQTIQIDDSTRFEDIASFYELEVGNYIELDAAFLGNNFFAIELEVDEADDRTIWEGPITALDVNSESMEIMNLPILLGDETSYENQAEQTISREAFFDLVNLGTIIKARWDGNQPVTRPPNSLELE